MQKIVIGFKKVKEANLFGTASHFYYENLDDYVNCLESLNLQNKDVIIINSELFTKNIEPTYFKGIELVEWLRIKLKRLNPIVVLGFIPLEQLVHLKHESIILLGPSTIYRRLPYSVKQINKQLEKLKPIENEDELYKSYYGIVSKIFSVKGFEHSFSNKYGIRLMKEAFESSTKEIFTINETNSIKITLDFAKADFLYKKSINEEDAYFKTQILDTAGKGSLSTFRKLMSDKKNKIFHIDDEGYSQNWYSLIKALGSLNANNYKTVSKENLITKNQINTKFVLNEIKNFKPNLILIDLRLLGQKESNLEDFYDYTGAELIESIRSINPWIPIIVASATSQIKSLENLQEHPYNISSLWSKPRVDTGKINIYEKLHDLLVKINNALSLFSFDVEKHNIVTNYYLKAYAKSKRQIQNFPNCTHYFIDTNCLNSQFESSIRLHLALHRFAKKDYNINDNKPTIIVLRDVETELQNLAFIDKKYIRKYKRDETDLESRIRISAAKYGLGNLKKLKSDDTTDLTDYHDNASTVIDDKIIYKINKENNNIELKYSKIVGYANTREEAEQKKSDFERFNAKTIFHADDVFRVIFLSKINSHFIGKLCLITSDRNLQDIMVEDFENIGFDVSDNETKYSRDRHIQIKKQGVLKGEIIGESVFVATLLDENEFKTTWFN